jgi:4-aminobutyrate aminotransferase-like enzyme
VHAGRCRFHRDAPATEEEAIECCVCYGGAGVQTLGCSHPVCAECLPRLVRRLCPYCRAPLADYDADKDRQARLSLVVESVDAQDGTDVAVQAFRRALDEYEATHTLAQVVSMRSRLTRRLRELEDEGA